MSEDQDEEERPCLHCMMVELVDQFFEEFPAATGDGSDTIDTDELITAIAKTVADLTCGQNGTIRQQIMEKLMREIMDYDAEFRREDASGAGGSVRGHWALRKKRPLPPIRALNEALHPGSALRLWRGACRDTNLAHFYRALGIALQRRCYRQILGPRSYLSKLADRLCGHPGVGFYLDPHFVRQATKS